MSDRGGGGNGPPNPPGRQGHPWPPAPRPEGGTQPPGPALPRPFPSSGSPAQAGRPLAPTPAHQGPAPESQPQQPRPHPQTTQPLHPQPTQPMQPPATSQPQPPAPAQRSYPRPHRSHQPPTQPQHPIQPPGYQPPGSPHAQPPSPVFPPPAPFPQPPAPSQPYAPAPSPYAPAPSPYAPAPSPSQPYAPAPSPSQPYAPAQPYAPPPAQPEQAPVSTMIGWQAAPDPAWANRPPQLAQPGQSYTPTELSPVAEPYTPPGESAALRATSTAVATFVLAARRALRLRIDGGEVTEAERTALEAAAPPVTDRDVQGFLAWRRSVHLVVAVAILPLLLFQIVEIVKSNKEIPGAFRSLTVMQFLVDGAFAAILWVQLRRWTQWQRQRRVLAAGWLGFFLMPFVLYLYPLRSGLSDALAGQSSTDPAVAQATGALFGMVASVVAMLQLTPKAISLMPGLLRGAITSKLLFPGASGPGWLLLLLAPIYALLMYVVLIIPYQLTGSGVFVPAMIGLIGAQVWLGRMGYQMARPERLDEVLVLVRKVRTTYIALNVFGLIFVMIGLADLLEQFQIPLWTGVHLLLSLLVNVLLLTLIATDQIVANLVRGQRLLGEPGTAEAQAEFARDIAHFDDAPRPSAPVEPPATQS